MEVKAPLVGVVVVFANIDEMSPQGGIHTPDILPMLAERYTFAFRPQLGDSLEQFRQNGMKFEMGKFVHDERESVITDFTIWNDGFVVTATTTEDAESFLVDVLTWGKQKLNLRIDLGALGLRAYRSQVAVEFDRSLAQMLISLEPISNAYSEALRNAYDDGEFPDTQVTSLKIDYDHAVAPSAFQTFSPFIIERRENHRFTDSVFWSQAPLQTKEHVKLLENFERLMSR